MNMNMNKNIKNKLNFFPRTREIKSNLQTYQGGGEIEKKLIET